MSSVSRLRARTSQQKTGWRDSLQGPAASQAWLRYTTIVIRGEMQDMRYFLIMLFALADLSGQCFAAEGQSSDDSVPPSQPAEKAAQDSAGKKQGEKPHDDSKKSAGGEEAEPDCD
jgi:hypothetical protein